MGLAVHQVDAFTERPFAGNPAAVCVLDVARDAPWMQAVAAEMNHSATAFLVPRREGGAAGAAAGFDLRWFTPTTEVDLCGHATLAAAQPAVGGRRAGGGRGGAPPHPERRADRPTRRRRLDRDGLPGAATAPARTVRVEPRGERVILTGQAVTVLVGELVGPAAG